MARVAILRRRKRERGEGGKRREERGGYGEMMEGRMSNDEHGRPAELRRRYDEPAVKRDQVNEMTRKRPMRRIRSANQKYHLVGYWIKKEAKS